MLLLIVYVLIALGFSFLCSVAEAVLLSITPGHIAIMEKQQHPAATVLRNLKDNVNRPLAAILILNTIAHTMGAAGAGAQAASVFGNAYLGIASAVLTFLILVFSEIIPKTLGAHYWKQLAPGTAYGLRGLVWLLWPLVKISEQLTNSMTEGPTLRGFNRQELEAMAELSSREGQLSDQEMELLRNTLALTELTVEQIMTPRTVVFGAAESLPVGEFLQDHHRDRFSRIPIFDKGAEDVTGFVLRHDLLLAQARGMETSLLAEYRRDLTAVPESMPLSRALEIILRRNAHIMLVVDEYGGLEGIVTLEDFLETLLGEEIVDESDRAPDMQKIARRLARRRLRKMGADPAAWDDQDSN